MAQEAGRSKSELTVEMRHLEEVTLLYPRGFINAHTVRVFEGEIKKALSAQRFRIVINCAGLAYIASAGLGAIMGAIEEIRENGGDLRLSDLNETVRNIFEILGFHHLYRIYPSETDAVLSFGRPEEAL
jgi:anti-sigma B factor antagonist